VLRCQKHFFQNAANMTTGVDRTPHRGDRLAFSTPETAMPLLTFTRAETRANTDLLGEIKAVNRLSERRFPSCTVELLPQSDARERVTVELAGPPSEVADGASWYCAELRDRGVLCDRVVAGSD
jgi:hypothetical protein